VLEGRLHAVSGARRRTTQEALVGVYLAATAALAKLNDGDAAWLAADRAGALAEAVPDPALVAAT
jgi:hypothetical protein